MLDLYQGFSNFYKFFSKFTTIIRLLKLNKKDKKDELIQRLNAKYLNAVVAQMPMLSYNQLVQTLQRVDRRFETVCIAYEHKTGNNNSNKNPRAASTNTAPASASTSAAQNCVPIHTSKEKEVLIKYELCIKCCLTKHKIAKCKNRFWSFVPRAL